MEAGIPFSQDFTKHCSLKHSTRILENMTLSHSPSGVVCVNSVLYSVCSFRHYNIFVSFLQGGTKTSLLALFVISQHDVPMTLLLMMIKQCIRDITAFDTINVCVALCGDVGGGGLCLQPRTPCSDDDDGGVVKMATT